MKQLIKREAEYERIIQSITRRDLIGQRNRLFIQTAATTGMILGELCKIQIWQLTYWHLRSDHEAQLPYRQIRECPAPSRYPLGLYRDRSFKKIIPLEIKNRHSITRYIQALGKQAHGDSYLFPDIRKGNHARLDKPIDESCTRKFLSAARKNQNIDGKFTWSELKKLSVARRLSKGCSTQSIIDETAYNDETTIRRIAREFGLPTTKTQMYITPHRTGFDYIGSFLTDNVIRYQDKINYVRF